MSKRTRAKLGMKRQREVHVDCNFISKWRKLQDSQWSPPDCQKPLKLHVSLLVPLASGINSSNRLRDSVTNYCPSSLCLINGRVQGDGRAKWQGFREIIEFHLQAMMHTPKNLKISWQKAIRLERGQTWQECPVKLSSCINHSLPKAEISCNGLLESVSLADTALKENRQHFWDARNKCVLLPQPNPTW